MAFEQVIECEPRLRLPLQKLLIILLSKQQCLNEAFELYHAFEVCRNVSDIYLSSIFSNDLIEYEKLQPRSCRMICPVFLRNLASSISWLSKTVFRLWVKIMFLKVILWVGQMREIGYTLVLHFRQKCYAGQHPYQQHTYTNEARPSFR